MNAVADIRCPLTVSTLPKVAAANVTRVAPPRGPGGRAKRTAHDDVASETRFDDELVTRVADGDLDAAMELKARYGRPMLRAALAILDDRVEAKRAVEVALEDACTGWPPERGQVAKWLLRLARRAALARRRSIFGVAA